MFSLKLSRTTLKTKITHTQFSGFNEDIYFIWKVVWIFSFS